MRFINPTYSKIVLPVIVSLFLANIPCMGQKNYQVVPADPNSCEINSLYFHMLGIELGNNRTWTVKVKYYGGVSETNAASTRRADHVRRFLIKSKGFDNSRLAFISSGRLKTTEDPKLEFYFVRPGEGEGKLFLVSYAKPNFTPCMDCCGDGPAYPQNVGLRSKKRKK